MPQVGLLKQSAIGMTFKQQQDEKMGILPTGGLEQVADRALGTLKDSQGSVLDINNLLSFPVCLQHHLADGDVGPFAVDDPKTHESKILMVHDKE
jgi:hypothetical protein